MDPLTLTGAGGNFVAGMGIRVAINTLSELMKRNHDLKLAERVASTHLEIEKLQKLVGGGEKFTDNGNKITRRIGFMLMTMTVLGLFAWMVVTNHNMTIKVPEELTHSSFWELINPFGQRSRTFVDVDLVGTLVFRILEIWELFAGFYVVGSNK
ncbi:hypothetical protein [Caudoviricetes sp.]|nr:hypothetical protein [Caudoviricetes sp.]UOF81033.1 hypothetical protein [Caudoviricetes sp.]UOF81387.1 hypothetical protein [Caudoviricetes sp.]